MRLVKDRNVGAFAVYVPCIQAGHKGPRFNPTYTMFLLAEGYADLDGVPFQAYYCDKCVAASATLQAAVLCRKGEGR